MPLLEEVFGLSGIPTHTFVEPMRYTEIKVSIRTPGRCMVVEGPSGIGKTTTITKAISELGINEHLLNLSARRKDDLEFIAALPDMPRIGTVIIDDFHRLDDSIKVRLSDFMKVLADTEDDASKLILIGINKAGQQLIKFAQDLGLRIDIFRLEANPTYKVKDLISLGEKALGIAIADKERIAHRAQGSFQIAQLLCHKLCTLSGVTETVENRNIDLAIEVLVEDVLIDLGRQFKEPALTFARGSKLRREGRAPYLHILRWLAESDEWSLDLAEAVAAHPEHRPSVGQVLDKGYLAALLNDPAKKPVLEPHFHFEASTSVLSVEDPKLIFYLKNIVWRAFAEQAGFTSEYFHEQYDFALSFAGTERRYAERLHDILVEREISVFYDANEQHRILARNVEEYLAPIYRSEAKYVIPFLTSEYPKRIWTKIESDQFKERFGQNAVIPIRFTTVVDGFFSDVQKYGYMAFDPSQDVEVQLQDIASMLSRRLIADRTEVVRDVSAQSVLDL
jgi:hypothetical protein